VPCPSPRAAPFATGSNLSNLSILSDLSHPRGARRAAVPHPDDRETPCSVSLRPHADEGPTDPVA
jgi:hypothetical protein